MVRVTESLRSQWRAQHTQMVEELDYTQDGSPRPAESKIELLIDLRVMEKLLALPMGTRFDSRVVHAEARQELGY